MAHSPRPPISLPELLIRNRNFVLLWGAYGISAIGDHLSEMALLQEAGGLQRHDITRVQALLTFCFFVPFVVLGPLAGWWADRFSRKWTMVATDLIRAGIMVSISFVVPLLLRAGWGDFAVALPLLVTGGFAAFFSPARQALLPTLIRDEQLVRANAMLSAMGTIGAILSGWLGGKLVDMALAGHFHIVWNYRLDAITFVLSASLLVAISMRRARTAAHTPLVGVWTPLIEGFRYVRAHRRILQIILLGTAFWAAAGVVISVVPALVREVFGGTFADAGMYRGLIAAGLAIGAGVMTVFGQALPLPLAVLGGLSGGAAWILALDAAYVFKLGRVFTGASLFMIGVHGAALLITVMVVIQRFVPDARRGRVFGVSDTTTMAAMALATGALGLPHIANLDQYVPYLLALVGLGLGAGMVLAWRVYMRRAVFPPVLWLIWQVARFFVFFWCRARREGPCTVPRRGPVIIAANHTAGVDPLIIQATLPYRTVSYIVAREYYERPIAGWFMRLVGCVPINRENPSKSFLAGCLKLLRSGGCLGIFPQGTFEVPGEPPPEVRGGVGLLALRSGATIVPCHISGTRYFDNPFASFFVRHRVRIRYGRPIDVSAFADRRRDRAAAQEVADLVMRRIRELAPAEPSAGVATDQPRAKPL